MSDENRFSLFINKHLNAPISNKQKVFDLIFGVIFPFLLLLYDPFSFFDIILDYYIGVYIAIGIGSLTLISWLFFPDILMPAVGLITGIQYFGFSVAFFLAFYFTPFNLMFLIIVISIFGFTPYLTAFCYLRSARRAMKIARVRYSKKILNISMVLGIFLTLALSAGVQYYLNQFTTQAMETILHGEAGAVEGAVKDIQIAFWCRDKCYRDIVMAYNYTDDPTMKARYEDVYHALTGNNIKEKAWR